MINAEEHKKLLAQIAELEKNSVNRFDVEKEFFLIDSNNLAEIQTRLYGYSIQVTGIYEQDNLTEDAVKNLDGRGCYVYVEARDGHITIKQDLNGCWGIYLFRHGDYFALSNSFFRLLDHIKFNYPLTVNRDYCHYLMVNDLVSHAHLETAVNEIQLVERNAVIHIDTSKKRFERELIDYRENTIPLDSEKSIAILDQWVEFWSSVLYKIAQHTQFITTDLSGGFDSRISFIMTLHSGIDLNKTQVNSINGTDPAYKEDYEIASKIAAHYGLKLNQAFTEQQTFLNYSLNDAFNADFYMRQTIHKSNSLLQLRKSIDKIYSLSGYGGELIRGNWLLRFASLEQFWRIQTQKPYSRTLSSELSCSIKNILESAFGAIRNKYKIEDPNSLWFAEYLYQEARCRHHFGKFTLSKYFGNEIVLSPAIDPGIRTVRLDTPECPDPQLLMTLLFTRYEPDLLKFPFQDKRSIAPETIAYAQKLNARFPRHFVPDNANWGGGLFNLQPRDLQAEKILAEGKNNPNISKAFFFQTCLKSVFKSTRTHGLFTIYFDEEIYRHAVISNKFSSILGVTRVLEDVEISQRNHPPYQDMRRFLEQDFCQIYDDESVLIVDKFKRYFTVRVDVKFVSEEQGDFQIVSVSDDKTTVGKPAWFNKSGIGYIIQSYAGKLELVAKATSGGRISLSLKGLDIRDSADKTKRVPYWIDYTKLVINEKVIFDKLTPAWHDKSYRHNFVVKADEEIKIQVEWQPHRSDV